METTSSKTGHTDSATSKVQGGDKPAFEPRKGKVLEHTKVGVWDLYQERDQLLSYLPTSWKIDAYTEMWNDLPYLWKAIRDLASVAWPMLSLYLVLTLVKSLLPALTLWYSGKLLSIVKSSVDKSAFDARSLIRVVCGRALCSATAHFLYYACSTLSTALNRRCRQFYSSHIFHAMARLDVPTWEDPAVSAQINALFPQQHHTISWTVILTTVETLGAILRMLSQTVVLFGVLRGHEDGLLFAVLTFASNLVSYMNYSSYYRFPRTWAATTRDKSYIRMEGLKRLVNDPKHRKEVVAGGLAQYLDAEYRTLVGHVGRIAGDFWTAFYDSHNDNLLHPIRIILVSLCELPLIVFSFRAVQQPSRIPIALASLHLMQEASDSFMAHVRTLLSNTGDFSEQLLNLRKLFEANNIPNKIADGTIPFPENQQSIRDGISLEFRNVSFKYPGSEKYALRDISFRVEQGQLCVILGSNGSGKSTVLKLIARLYDPTEGTILIDEQDIRTLRMEDLRRALTILFQDYTLFPLTIRENIALGDPSRAHDNAAIDEAVRMGGASEVIARLSDGLDTYLERPVRDLYEGLPDGAPIFGGKVDNGYLRGIMGTPTDKSLSGGEMQRIAVARTFMRSMSEEQKVGLLLFDEPSASLDPKAEQDLFSRLRELRGTKTMIFSTHRFGDLTRHADLVLHLNESAVIEAGTHEGLMKREGSEYARLWHIQAQAFL